ncbi:uncharacterized protein C22orf42-like [Nomascus leucogenys]|uniref:uncharacterized protein C22orf42-like n=1 Tax=Nomascus leucogenys TaxID=61853 RepID=UPI00122D6231|nr:uncharacterized protein C22orf42-like [Nomascus leucogenys]
MGNKLSSCLGNRGGRHCDCSRPDVGNSHEAEIANTVAAAAPAAAPACTTEKREKWDLRAQKAQVMQDLSLPKTRKMPEMPKGLDADTKRYLRMIWRRHGIWPLENTGNVEIKSLSSFKQIIPVYSFSAPY